MSTTDSNGLVLLQQTDNLTPLEGTINTVTASVSAAFNANTRIFQVANQAARDTLANSRTPTANNPLFVWRQDTKEMEYNYGTGWSTFPPAPDPNIITINGINYQRSGVITGSWTTAFQGSTPVFYRNLTVSTPYKAPNGWYFHCWQADSSYYGFITENILNQTATTMTLYNSQFIRNNVEYLRSIGWELKKL